MPGHQCEVCSGEAPARADVCQAAGEGGPRGTATLRHAGGGAGHDLCWGLQRVGIARAWEKRGERGKLSRMDRIVAESTGENIRRY